MRRPHLGGALGHAILTPLRTEGLVEVDANGRTLTLRTDAGDHLGDRLPGLVLDR
ncbi:hypothetical protein [Amycolatopsis methanolica]|uniref:hypothetical protein n=1 Tax=Amycolatopsis methanolica TaxID=1814 RepID=UPI0034459477